MKRLLAIVAAVCACFLSGAAPALAHPHIFIDAKAVLVFDTEGRFVGIRHAWTFDEAFSAWSIQGLDVNQDGVTTSAEMQELADDHVSGLSSYEFYTFAGEEGDAENLKFEGDPGPRLDLVDGRSRLSFSVHTSEPYRIKNTLEIAINDPEYYAAITFAGASAVTMENAPAGCSIEMEAPHDMSPDLAEQLYEIPPDVTVLPKELSDALRGVQGAILVHCDGREPPATALDAVTEVAQTPAAAPATPFGGPPPEPGFVLPRTGFLGWVAQVQADFYAALTAALGRLKEDTTAFWVLGGLSFLYGIFHAAGPGHGKVVISSYILANERQLRRGVVLSFLSAMLQSVVAVVFIGVAAMILGLTSTAMGNAANWIGIASYALVAALGLWLIARKVFRLGHSHGRPRKDTRSKARALLYDDPEHEHHDHVGHEHAGHTPDHRDVDGEGERDHHHHVVTAADLRGDWREQLAVVFAVGLRPCSGALVVLVFALSQGVLLAGIAAVFLMGLGTAITVAALASLAVGAKGLARRLSGARSGLATAIIWWLELLASIGVFAFGVVLLLASV